MTNETCAVNLSYTQHKITAYYLYKSFTYLDINTSTTLQFILKKREIIWSQLYFHPHLIVGILVLLKSKEKRQRWVFMAQISIKAHQTLHHLPLGIGTHSFSLISLGRVQCIFCSWSQSHSTNSTFHLVPISISKLAQCFHTWTALQESNLGPLDLRSNTISTWPCAPVQ